MRDTNLHPTVVDAFGSEDWFISPKGSRVVIAEPLGRRVFFVVSNRRENIHRRLMQGSFYEQNILIGLRKFFPPGGVFVDIGANIGNHTLFMATHGDARRVIPIEPNANAFRLLVAMLRINGIEDRVVLDHLGIGLAAEAGEGFGIDEVDGFLGLGQMVAGSGEIAVKTGDAVLADEPRIDMIKIDVEAMEMPVLAGLSETIARHRPTLFVEVDNLEISAFKNLMEKLNYKPLQRYKATKSNQNFLMGPR